MPAVLIKASLLDKAVINNLMQFYMYDFSEFVDCNILPDGLYPPYTELDHYWIETDRRFPYIIRSEETYIGFVLVKLVETSVHNYFSIAEFFVMKKYRKQGIGAAMAKEVFDLHSGKWEVWQKETNTPAQLFWHKVIKRYTNNRFTEKRENGKLIQDFQN